MEPASAAASRALSSELRERLAADSEIPPLVAWMWQQLVAMFGAAVLTAYGDDDKPPRLWIGALSKLTSTEAKQGIAALAKQGRSYPPNLTEVLEACRARPAPPYHAAYRLPPPPRPASREHIDGCLARMRAAVGSAAPNTRREGETVT